MTAILPTPFVTISPQERGRITPTAMVGLSHGVFRLPTDPLFYADFLLDNIVSGSRYWIAWSSDISVVLATGVASSTSEVIVSMESYESPMLVTVRIRKAGYEPFETQAYHYNTGGSSYIIQQADSIYQ